MPRGGRNVFDCSSRERYKKSSRADIGSAWGGFVGMAFCSCRRGGVANFRNTISRDYCHFFRYCRGNDQKGKPLGKANGIAAGFIGVLNRSDGGELLPH